MYMYIQRVKIQRMRREGLVGCISFLPLLLDPLFLFFFLVFKRVGL